jgi:membrane peptidoglycan carboxypeptidase
MSNTKNPRLGLLLAIIALVLAGAAAHYAYQVHLGRDFTRQTLIPRIQSTPYALRPDDLGPWRQEALLKVVDPSFPRHGGVDFKTPGQGIATITQTLAQLLFFDDFAAGTDKLRQSILAAYVLDPLLSKQDQLLLYINMVPMGGRIKGLAEASQAYFHKPFAELSQDEYLALVGDIIDPVSFDPVRFPQRSQERVARIKMLLSGQYQPKGLFDVFYGKLDVETRKHLPPYSYFDSYYN